MVDSFSVVLVTECSDINMSVAVEPFSNDTVFLDSIVMDLSVVAFVLNKYAVGSSAVIGIVAASSVTDETTVTGTVVSDSVIVASDSFRSEAVSVVVTF